MLNKFLLQSNFIMEDISTLRELMLEGDWMFKIDPESALHHIPVHPQFQPFRGFIYKGNFFKYVAMYVEVKHAPMTFNKFLLPVIGIIGQHLGIKVIAYCDDVIFPDKNNDELMNKEPLILQILEELGYKIQERKLNLQIAQDIEILDGHRFQRSAQVGEALSKRKPGSRQSYQQVLQYL
ncbi:MAG: hypothetical protein EZS28_037355 [Streblomastix strix]|uniref:Reverse transcriptase domain-containing protein n=1 Tax=Streblomastix strix TaxID=222440 RepID=A0A5J4U9N2_9EUKA|nr:MAG: hypothetical protein EZS28_037355 [Streblomastix strix]